MELPEDPIQESQDDYLAAETEEMQKDIREEELCQQRWIFARKDAEQKKEALVIAQQVYRAAELHWKEAEANLAALIAEKYPSYDDDL